MRFLFFFRVYCDSSSKTKGESSDSSTLISIGTMGISSCLAPTSPIRCLACILFIFSLSLLAAASTAFIFSCGMRQYCSKYAMIYRKLVVLKHTQSAASFTTCSAYSAAGALACEAVASSPTGCSSISWSMKPSSSFFSRPRQELIRQQSPLSSNFKSRQFDWAGMQSIASKDYFKLYEDSRISIQKHRKSTTNRGTNHSQQALLGKARGGVEQETFYVVERVAYQSFFVISYKVIQKLRRKSQKINMHKLTADWHISNSLYFLVFLRGRHNCQRFIESRLAKDIFKQC